MSPLSQMLLFLPLSSLTTALSESPSTDSGTSTKRVHAKRCYLPLSSPTTALPESPTTDSGTSTGREHAKRWHSQDLRHAYRRLIYVELLKLTQMFLRSSTKVWTHLVMIEQYYRTETVFVRLISVLVWRFMHISFVCAFVSHSLYLKGKEV